MGFIQNIRQIAWKSAPLRFFYFRALGTYYDVACTHSVVSYQKSGHTWMRVMLAKLIQDVYNVKDLHLDIVWMAKNGAPKIAIFHSLAGIGLYRKPNGKGFTSIYSASENIKIRRSLHKKKIILLVRDPRDVVVSLYFELTKRHHLYNKPMSTFIRETYTLKKIIRYMNMWYKEQARRPQDFLVIRYEDMKYNTQKELAKIAQFVGIPATSTQIKDAVHFGSIENMRILEKRDAFSDNRLRAKNVKDKDSYKVRKGKVGGYYEYVTEEDLVYIDERIRRNLETYYGYY